MKPNISVKHLQTIHRILRDAEEAIFDGTGHRLMLSVQETEVMFGVSAILSAVSGALNIPLSAILSETRQAEAKDARQIAAWLIKRFLPGITVGVIAQSMERDRTTINHAIRYVNHRIDTDDKNFLNKLNTAESAVKKLIDENKTDTPGI